MPHDRLVAAKGTPDWPKTTAVVVCTLSFVVSTRAIGADEPKPPVLKVANALTNQPSNAPISPGYADGQELIVEIDLNGVRKGEFSVVAAANGDFLVKEADLKDMGVRPPYGTPVLVAGEARFSLSALLASELRFDESKLSLYATLPPERLQKKTLDVETGGRPQRLLEPRDNSAFFNYRALYSGGTAEGPLNLTLSTELGIRVGDFLLRSDSTHARGAGPSQNIRYNTSLIYDDRRTLQRWILGDFGASSGELGGAVNLGGVSFSKSYDIDPYLIRQPMASFVSNVTVPSQADIYLDGVRVRTETVQPGQFALRNLNYYGGQREITVVIRDRLGREQTLSYPFYFTAANLREGLHEYSYNLGFQRKNLGVASNEYGDLALSAFHRYGFSDSLTLGGRTEAESGRFNMGTTAILRLDNIGVISSSLAAGRNPSGNGWASVARYTYQARQFSGQAELRRTSLYYETLGQSATSDRPKAELSAGASYSLPFGGNLSVDWRQLRQYRGGDQRNVSLGYSRNLVGSLSLIASVSQLASNLSPVSETSLFVALSYSPKRDVTANFSHSQRTGISSDLVELGTNTPVGEGVGYRMAAERTSSAGLGTSYRLAPSLQYNGPHGVYTADLVAKRTSDGVSQQAYQLGISGGVAYVGGAAAFSRPVTDSFGIVKVGDLAGIRVYQSAQEIGRTDSTGRVFLPNLASYVSNRVAIDDRDIPIDYVISSKELNISPALRSGSMIRFDVLRIQAITGRLTIRAAGKQQVAEYIDLVILLDGKEMVTPTGSGGEFYIENLKPGRYAARFVLDGRRCAFELTVPPSQEMLINLGELNVCQFDN